MNWKNRQNCTAWVQEEKYKKKGFETFEEKLEVRKEITETVSQLILKFVQYERSLIQKKVLHSNQPFKGAQV
jgi:hypothetical protein